VIDRGEMTPTYKVKRNIIQERYKDVIDALYVEKAETIPE